MNDLISRQYLLDEYDRQHQGPPGGARKIIEKAPTIESGPRWIPVTERSPDEDYCTGMGVQYSEGVLVTIVNHGNDDERNVDVACTVDGEWRLAYPTDSPCIPRWCDVIAWMPLPEPYREEEQE